MFDPYDYDAQEFGEAVDEHLANQINHIGLDEQSVN